jgi:protein ImuA
MSQQHSSSDSESSKPSLEALLRRGDVWRGHSQSFVPSRSVATGFDELDSALLYGGWPEACLIELAQDSFAGSWRLLTPAARQIGGVDQSQAPQGMVAVVNPPAMPYAVGLLQQGIPLERMLVVPAAEKADFIACFVELARSPACSMIMAWQPKQKLSYTELRKCQLATHEQAGLYFFFRHSVALQQSSPAALRIHMQLQQKSLQLSFVKQKGRRQEAVVHLALPENWQAATDYKVLGQQVSSAALLSGRVVSMEAKRHKRFER